LGVFERTVKTTFLALAVVPLLLSACTDTPPTKAVLERITNLGFGFRRVVLAEPVNTSFESVGHFEYLYYGDQRICQVGACSVSPSGAYAIYQDGPSGNLFLFRRADSRLIQLTRDFVAPAESFQWHEDANTVEAHFTMGHGPKTFAVR